MIAIIEVNDIIALTVFSSADCVSHFSPKYMLKHSHLAWLFKSTQFPLPEHVSFWQTFISDSQYDPWWYLSHKQKKPVEFAPKSDDKLYPFALVKSIQVALFKHGLDEQGLVSSWQAEPVKKAEKQEQMNLLLAKSNLHMPLLEQFVKQLLKS